MTVDAQADLAQAGIWLNERLGTAGTVYHLPLTVRLVGALDEPALQEAVRRLLVRHPLLSSVIDERAGAPYIVGSATLPRLETLDLSAEPEPEVALQNHVTAEVSRPFDLAAGPLVRISLVTMAEHDHVLVVVAHHLVFDGESKGILVRDLGLLYNECCGGAVADLPPLVSHEQHVAREQARVAERVSAAGDYWTPRWRPYDVPVLPGLTVSGPFPTTGAAHEFSLDDKSRSQLESCCSAWGCSVFELLLCGLQALLLRYGNDAAVVAVDVTSRGPESRESIGVFVHEYVVTSPAGPSPTLRQLLSELRQQLRGVYRFRDVPLARAVGLVKPAVAMAPILLSYTRASRPVSFDGLTATVDWFTFNGAARNALRLHVVDSTEALAVSLQYSPAALPPAQAVSVGGHFTRLLDAALESPDAPVDTLPVLGEAEFTQLLSLSTAAPVVRPTPPTLHAMLADRVRSDPEETAYVHQGVRLSYAELNERANHLAGRLIAAGMGEGTVVAISAERSLELVVALWAVLKSGAAYLPLDPAYPAERLAYVLHDAEVSLLLTQQRLLPLWAETPVPTWLIDDVARRPEQVSEAPSPGGPASRAYVIYTSGSTGRPKGVEVSHGALVNFLLAMRDELTLSGGEVFLAQTSLSFDISALELYLPVVMGGHAVIADEGMARNGEDLARLIRDEQVTHVQATPSGWRVLLEAGFQGSAVQGLVGGEALPLDLARELRSSVARLWNVYGPTETTIWSTIAEIPEAPTEVTIGRPIANTQTYVLDAQLRLVPAGLPGELCIGGAGLARGYLRRPALTAERFVPDPYGAPGGRLYRTGDRVLQRPDGQLVYLGRTDRQVKLRGHRIELPEIEARLVEAEDVAQAAVVLHTPVAGEEVLVAYVVGRGSAPSHTELAARLTRQLPGYMVPGQFVLLDELPLTPNGKVDLAALPEPGRPPTAEQDDAGEVVGLAADLQRIWCEVLRVESVGLDDDLFELGGHSLTITQITARVRRQLNVDLPLYVLFDTPTIRGALEAIDDLGGGAL